MNERIWELELQSYVTLTKAGLDGRNEKTTTIFDREKFAELIVRECMSQIEEVKNIKAGNAGPVYTQGFDDGMFVAIRTIEEHFGVEE